MNWKNFNFWNLWVPFIFFFVGLIMGILFPCNHTSKKNYPIEAQCYWQTNGYSSYPKFECDSIKGDTFWKDGNRIVAKNIINVSFK
jgi:hypothetical protein